MTSQTLTRPVSTQPSDAQSEFGQTTPVSNPRIFKSIQTHYRSNHQAEFLAITAQVESLLEELQTLDRAKIIN